MWGDGKVKKIIIMLIFMFSGLQTVDADQKRIRGLNGRWSTLRDIAIQYGHPGSIPWQRHDPSICIIGYSNFLFNDANGQPVDPPNPEYRAYHVFDLSNITDTVTSASLQLSQGAVRTGVDDPNGSETIGFYSVSVSRSELTNGNGNQFNALGTGTLYSTITLRASGYHQLP